jgi:multiple sugar transport system ATP-binding protein
MAIEMTESLDSVDAEEVEMRIENLRKTFDDGQVVACEDVSLDIHRDEFVVILGPSGCGKTTTLRCIAGLETPDDGRIYIQDEDIAQRKPKNRDLAFVFQSIALFPHMTVRENIRFGLDMKTDLDISEKNARVDDVAETLGIGELLDRKPAALSGGQQQRVSLGRAMVMEPTAFLLDEPFSALDAQLRDQMRTEVKQLQRKLETSMIFVTHDQDEAMVLADKIVIMDDGRIQQVDPPKEVYSNPANRFIAQFIGSPSANLFDCQYDETAGTLDVAGTEASIDVPRAAVREASLTQGQTVSFGVRPENVHLERGRQSQSSLTAEVILIEPHGDRDAVRLDAGGTTINAVLGQDEILPSEGDRVTVEFDLERFWLFDEEGERLF